VDSVKNKNKVKKQILFSKKIVESQHIPISQSGDSLELMKNMI